MNKQAMELAKDVAPMDALTIAEHYLKVYQAGVERAPKTISDHAAYLFKEVESTREGLESELWEAVDMEGDRCQDCAYCIRCGDGFVEPRTRECDARKAKDCPGVEEVLG